MAPCLISDKGLLDLKDFYSKIEKYINRSSLYIQALMVHIGIDKLTYSEEAAYEMTQFVIDATDEEFHPTVNAIIHRGLEGYFLYSDQEFDALSEDFSEVVQVVKEEL